MGGSISKEQLKILSVLQGVISTHPAGTPEKELHALLLWVHCSNLHCEAHVLLEAWFWQEANKKLYHLATMRDKAASKLLPAARITVEAFSRNSKGNLPLVQLRS